MAPPRRRGPGLAIAVLAVVVVLLGGALAVVLMRDEQPAPASAAAAPTSASATTPSAEQTGGPGSSRAACLRLASVTGGLPDDVFVAADLPALKSVGELAAASDSFSIATGGLLLADTVTDAIAAQGQGDEATHMESVKKYVRDLRKSCAIAGFPT